MRVDLKVPFEEKDEAKALGASWDPARKVWYTQDIEDLQPFLRWMPERLTLPHRGPPGAPPARPASKPQPRAHRQRSTSCSDDSLPTCACSTPPWEHCEHTRSA